MDIWWLAARYDFRDSLRLPSTVDPDVVLVEIDEYSIDQRDTKGAWHGPSIGWNPYIAKTLDILRVSGARAVGIDRIQPEATQQYLKSPTGNDDLLLESLSKFDKIVWAKEFKRGAWLQPWEPLISAIPGAFDDPNAHVGFADLERHNGQVSSFEPALRGTSDEISFTARVAEQGFGVRSRLAGNFWEIPGHVRIPLRADHTALIYFEPGIVHPHPDGIPFEIYSMRAIALQPVRPDPRFKGKFVLLGTSFSGDPDRHPIPMGLAGPTLVPGVRLHANILSNIVHSSTIREPGEIQIWLIATLLGAFGPAMFLTMRWLRAVFAILFGAAIWVVLAGYLFVSNGFALPLNLPLIGLGMSSVIMGGYLSLSEERERRKVMGLWGQYQDPRLVSFLLENETARGGQGQEMEVTVLFADLKSFTKTVEHLTPTETIVALNRYLGMLNSVIRSHGGIVDKYLGDGLMAQWGAPAVPGEAALVGHARAALNACLQIQDSAKTLANEEKGNAGPVGFGLRLTLHTGPVVFGWVGAQRLELTIIGDTVNVTSRLQESAKQMDVDFLISESTLAQVGPDVKVGRQAEMQIRGRDRPLRVYEVVSGSHTV